MNYRKPIIAIALGFALGAIPFVCAAKAQVGDPATLLKEKLISDIKLTKATADRSDIVTAGDIVVLHKDGLTMCSSDTRYAKPNTYSGGVLKTDNGKEVKKRMGSWQSLRDPVTAMESSCSQRKFVAGEKFWITEINLGNNGIIVQAFSDPYNNVRYYADITFPFPKRSVPPADDFVKTVSEVFTVLPADDKASGASDQTAQSAKDAAAPTSAAPVSAAAIAPLPPPPPPADAPPPTIEVGETTVQVVAGFGQPTLIKKPSATKQVYVYKDMTLTFTNGKVSKID